MDQHSCLRTILSHIHIPSLDSGGMIPPSTDLDYPKFAILLLCMKEDPGPDFNIPSCLSFPDSPPPTQRCIFFLCDRRSHLSSFMTAAINYMALRVLTNRSIFASIAQFSRGISYFTYQAKQQLVCATKAFDPDSVSPQDVDLWQNVIRSGDRRTFEAPQVLSQTAMLGKRLVEVLYRIIEYAFTHTKDLELLEWICNRFTHENRSFSLTSVQERALGEGRDIEIAKLMLSHGYSASDSMTRSAASGGHVDLVKLLHFTSLFTFGCKERVMSAAAANGTASTGAPTCLTKRQQTATLTLCDLHENWRHPCSKNAMDGAATNGHLEIVKFLHSKRQEGCTTRSMDGAVENRHFEIIQFLHENRTEGCSRQAMIDAIARDDFETLKLLADNRGEDALEGALQFAGERGLRKYISYLFDASERASIPIILPREDLVNSAATKGNVKLIKFFHEHEYFRFSPKAMHNAAIAKHLHVVKFLHENRTEGCKVDTFFECDQKELGRIVDYLCVSRLISNLIKAIARAKREGRLLLAAKLEYSAANAKETYAYR